ncbi:MAG: gamma-glutamyl-gamma-aminobutyrate hydrolase family protein [Acidimicrobiales bacterium]
MAPLIGISAYEEKAAFGVWNADSVLVPASYVRAVRGAGGVPVVLPPVPGSADELTRRLDGVLLSGGPDVDPALYGEPAHPETGRPRHERDLFEIELLDAAGRHDVPVLAICRGIQVLNVARGGTLYQHLPDVVGHDRHSPVRDGYGVHEVGIISGSLLSGFIGSNRVEVPTHHHQAIDRVGSGLVVSARADDGTIEAVEAVDEPPGGFLVGVQWHPEVGDDPSLFQALVEAAARHEHEAVHVQVHASD